MKENDNSEYFYDLYQHSSQDHLSFNSEKIYNNNNQNIPSSKYIIINIYKL